MTVIDRSTKPEPSENISFSLPEIERFKLDNGLEVYFIRNTKLPILQFNLLTDAGSRYDPTAKKGLTNLFGMVLDEGAGAYDALQLSDQFDLLGSHFSVSSNQDNTYLMLQTLTENFDRSLELFASVLTKPHFDPKAFEREKRKVLTRLVQLQDEPDEIADLVYDYLSFGEGNCYAYPVIGYEDSVQNIGLEDVKDFYSQLLLPGNSALIVVGDASSEELKDKLNSHFKDWKSREAVLPPVENSLSKNPALFIFDKKDTVQSEIRIGHRSSKRSSADYFSKNILNTILGGQFTSRINLNLREKKGYTYGALSRFNYYKDAGYFYVSTSVGIENTANAVTEIMNELKGILNGVTPGELDFAKSSLIRKFPSNFETYKQIASNLTGMVIYSLPEDYFNTYIENIVGVSVEDVNSAAVKNIFPDDLSIVLVGDKEKLRPQLKDAGFPDAVEVNIKGEKIS